MMRKLKRKYIVLVCNSEQDNEVIQYTKEVNPDITKFEFKIGSTKKNLPFDINKHLYTKGLTRYYLFDKIKGQLSLQKDFETVDKDVWDTIMLGKAFGVLVKGLDRKEKVVDIWGKVMYAIVGALGMYMLTKMFNF